MKNKHGLSRNIPEAVKRTVRQRSGFGCVKCGLGIYQYEHVDPEFHEAKTHDPEAITLLCAQCHAKVTTGMLSKESIKDYMKAPFCRRSGFSNEFFDFGIKHPQLTIGTVEFIGAYTPIGYCDESIFMVEEPEQVGAPFRLSGTFYDSGGNPTLHIKRNEWFASNENWDVSISGKTMTIKERWGDTALVLVVDPPKGIVVKTLNMRIGRTGSGLTLLDDGTLIVVFVNEHLGTTYSYRLKNLAFDCSLNKKIGVINLGPLSSSIAYALQGGQAPRINTQA